MDPPGHTLEGLQDYETNRYLISAGFPTCCRLKLASLWKLRQASSLVVPKRDLEVVGGDVVRWLESKKSRLVVCLLTDSSVKLLDFTVECLARTTTGNLGPRRALTCCTFYRFSWSCQIYLDSSYCCKCVPELRRLLSGWFHRPRLPRLAGSNIT